MSKPSLKRFPPADASRCQQELDRIAGAAEPRTVRLSLGQVVPLLIDAVQSDRAWLADFADDTIQVDADLYEVLLAYQQLRRQAA
jgi:hypothetical protein